MAHPLVKHWPITSFIIGLVFGGIWWAATIQADMSYVKRDVAEIKAILTKPNHTAER